MPTSIKILITSAGSTNAINIIKALRIQKEFKVYFISTDINPLSAGFYLSDKHYLVPKSSSPKFIPSLLKICRKEKLRIVIPTHSVELSALAKNKEIFERNGIKIAISSHKTLLNTENKLKTNEYFEKWGIPFPKVYKKEDILKKKIKFPVIIKPVYSSGSKGIRVVYNQQELIFLPKDFFKKNIVQEYVKGEEYTIDGVCDLKGKMIAASPRIRLETRGGLATKSIIKSDSQILDYTKRIVEGFKIIGPFNVQCIKQGKKIKFIEVNSRFPSGGLPLTVKAGLNIPLIIIKLILGKKIIKPKIKQGLLMTRYWDSIILEKKGGKYRQL